MSIYNADEVLAMAQRIEHNGARYYSKAAMMVQEPKLRELLNELSRWEVAHEELFGQMREEFQKKKLEEPLYDPDDEAAQYLQAIADGHVFDLRSDPLEQITQKQSPTDLLKYALKMEKDSVIFYIGLKSLVQTKEGKDKVQDVVAEEMKHIAFLSREISALKA